MENKLINEMSCSELLERVESGNLAWSDPFTEALTGEKCMADDRVDAKELSAMIAAMLVKIKVQGEFLVELCKVNEELCKKLLDNQPAPKAGTVGAGK